MTRRFVILLALGVAGCQPTADVGVTFPIGIYTNCARGTRSSDGNLFLGAAGFESGAVLTLAQSGTTVNATYFDQNGVTQSFSFAATTSTSATFAEAGDVIHGFTSPCVLGPGNQQFYTATMTAGAGAMTYNAGTVFIALTGNLESDAGECGTRSAPGGSFL